MAHNIPDHKVISDAAKVLREGGLVAFPTETVYGLGADATNDKAIAEIFSQKNRPSFNPLIIHFSDTHEVKKQVEWNENAELLSRVFWPGPLTLVLKRKQDSDISLLASAGLETLAVRVPSHQIANLLMYETKVPIAAPSANISGHISPTKAEHVASEFGSDVFILNGGSCSVGIESTVVELIDKPVILRHGSITSEMLEKILGCSVAHIEGVSEIKSPGQLLRHYSPRAKLRLNAENANSSEAFLAFGSLIPFGAAYVLNLSQKRNLNEAAANLFKHLRALDKTGVETIAVAPIPETGVGIAINDRLKRGAS